MIENMVYLMMGFAGTYLGLEAGGILQYVRFVITPYSQLFFVEY